MSLLKLVLAWGAVTAWFLVFELVEQRLVGPAPAGRFRAGWKVYPADALLFTLFATLWFASLGSGGWLLLFLVLGLLMEGPARYRTGVPAWSRFEWKRLGAGVARVVVAGGIVALLV